MTHVDTAQPAETLYPAENRQLAAELRSLWLNLQAEGFTEDQALTICTAALTTLLAGTEDQP